MTNTKTTEWTKYVLIMYCVVLITATHFPSPAKHFSVSLSDKWAHFSAFALLAMLSGLHFVRLERWRPSQWTVLVAILMLYAAMDEITQIPVPGRFGDRLDWIADVLGIVTGVGVYVLCQRLYRSVRCDG